MDTIQVKARYYVAQLDKQLEQYPQLKHLEIATGLPKAYVVLGAGAFVFLMIFFNFAGKLLSNLLGWVYPAYRSFKALETQQKDDDTQWLTYWTVYGFVSILESFTDILLYWFPFYFFLKTVFLLWLMLPTFNGASTIYTRVLRPFLLQHKEEIDSSYYNLKAKVSAAASELDAAH
ncbi:ER membrane protein DP1/Yop1 [Lobosporangium transversale]|uniref:Protein YOP1 n=1 Tax=Lobosporangium transversale TaxID=64571 RepID=A0A1Y2GQS7_9FUNG|nr:TB2/DP1, HVA22 family-domain-containing protein [Lobosporangium transversale]KAF9916968.1 ER membrane protein DP1/Yop1 [Lobosporangium transversale]ORZ19214.1 TB2/DP1, HVA22 family-domain-containing protein [Lobosporangium transversale]|eukprot:XP_021882382.1 TB2/DP1, HVA22 family-domain-containing protein [Lobosporangium transversale]